MSSYVLKGKDLIQNKKILPKHLPGLTIFFSSRGTSCRREKKPTYFTHQMSRVLKNNRNVSMGLFHSLREYP